MPGQEQAHLIEPNEEMPQQYEVTQQQQQERAQVGRNSEFESDGGEALFYMGDVEQVIDDIAGGEQQAGYEVTTDYVDDQQQYRVDDTFLAEEDEWSDFQYEQSDEESVDHFRSNRYL